MGAIVVNTLFLVRKLRNFRAEISVRDSLASGGDFRHVFFFGVSLSGIGLGRLSGIGLGRFWKILRIEGNTLLLEVSVLGVLRC